MKFLFLLPCQFVCLTVKELNKHKFYLYISKWDDKVRVSVLKGASLDIFSGAVQGKDSKLYLISSFIAVKWKDTGSDMLRASRQVMDSES